MTTNRIILVDNATLSGVERLTGESQTLNLNNIDNDILCLEKLITAILFSDAIVGVDDYKDTFRSQRLKKFDFINFLSIEAETYNALAGDAADFARSMVFSFDGSKPAGDVVSFFESLRIDPQLRWDIFVSSEYLTLSALVKDTRDVHYETAIDSVFRNENTDSEASSAGKNFSPGCFARTAPRDSGHEGSRSSLRIRKLQLQWTGVRKLAGQICVRLRMDGRKVAFL
jgi:hypothetical protein